jgi:2-iminobutanoate/2-iminopropanoate deaminase
MRWLALVTGQVSTDANDDGAPLADGIEAQTRRVIENLKLVPAGVGSASTLSYSHGFI